MMAAMRPIRALLLDYSGVFTTPPFTAFPALEVAKGAARRRLLELLWGDYGDLAAPMRGTSSSGARSPSPSIGRT